MKKAVAKAVTMSLLVVSIIGGTTACGMGESNHANSPLNNYEVYETFAEEYKTMGDKLVEQYISEGMAEAEACAQAITEVIDKQVEDEKEFILKYMNDEDGNGVYDAIERGEITQEEIDKHYEGWKSAGSLD